jgi:hypothetical protein
MEIWMRPYAERKILHVTNAPVTAVHKDPGWQEYAEYAARGATLLMHPVASVLVEGGKYAYSKFTEDRTRVEPVIALRVPLAATKGLRFPAGHALDNHLYVGNPVVPDLYYTVAGFHRCVFEHKCMEAVRLLMHLGAKAIKVERVEGWGRTSRRSYLSPSRMLQPGISGLQRMPNTPRHLDCCSRRS